MTGGSPIAARDIGILGAILALAVLARVVGLNAPLWYDEILTLETHLRLPWGQMSQSYSMNHHYFYDLQAKAAMALFGDEPWVLRLPAALFGVAAIVAMWVLARDVAGVWVAHLVALLLALSFHHIWFSQNARGYSELAFWSTLGLVFFLRGLQEPRLATWVGFGLTLAAATYTHLTGAFFFAALGLVWLIVLGVRGFDRRLAGRLIWRPLLAAALGVVILLAAYAPLIPSLGDTVANVAGTSAIDVMQEYQNPVWTVIEAVRTGVGSAGPLVSLLAVSVLGLCVLGGVAAARNESGIGPWFPLAVAVHILLTMAVLMALGMRIWPRFFFVDIGYLMLLIVMGVRAVCDFSARLIGRPGWAAGGFGLAAAAMLAVSCLLASRNYQAPKQDLAGAYALVEATRAPGQRVYAVGPAATVFTGHFKADWQVIGDEAGYATARAEAGPALFVVAFPGRVLRRYSALDADREAGVLTELRWFAGTLGDGQVLVLQRD